MLEVAAVDEALASTQKFKQAERLHDAFQQFNELSQNLSDSYQELQAQVVNLTGELAEARSARLQTLTEKEQLANQLHGLLEALPGGVVVVDEEGFVIRDNPVACELFDRSLIGCSWSGVVAENVGDPLDNAHELRLKNGKTVNLSVRSLSPDPGHIVLLTDISEVRSLQELVNRQKRLSAMGEMVASLAHQVRTPLTTAILYASQLGNEALRSEQHLKFAKKLLERLRFLERQVNDMLTFARDGHLARANVSLEHLIHRIREAAEMLLIESDIEFHCDHGCVAGDIMGNEDALIGIAMNLVANAMQVMDGAGEIQLQVSQLADDRVRISILDHGPGIDDQNRDRLFEPFFTTRSNGTGLGLAVVESVVTAHQGRVWCEAGQPGGAIFHIELPLSQDQIPLSGDILRHEQMGGGI